MLTDRATDNPMHARTTINAITDATANAAPYPTTEYCNAADTHCYQ
jgi:hypothetical protein